MVSSDCFICLVIWRVHDLQWINIMKIDENTSRDFCSILPFLFSFFFLLQNCNNMNEQLMKQSFRLYGVKMGTMTQLINWWTWPSLLHHSISSLNLQQTSTESVITLILQPIEKRLTCKLSCFYSQINPTQTRFVFTSCYQYQCWYKRWEKEKVGKLTQIS